MNIVFDDEKMNHLMSNLYTLTGIHTAILDVNEKELFSTPEEPAFCRLVYQVPEGYQQCQHCMKHVSRIRMEKDGTLLFRCYAGLCKRLVPIRVGGELAAYLLIGPYLEEDDREEQWERALSQLDWYGGGLEDLKKAFDSLEQCPDRQLAAYLEIVQVLRTYVYMSGTAMSGQYTDQQKLKWYLDQHYTEKLSLSSISQAMNMGRTKLCALAKSMSGGQTISQLINQRRIEKACTLLLRTDMPISEVGEAVGISDYNYFSKVFRLAMGVTPSAYRRSRETGKERKTGPSK